MQQRDSLPFCCSDDLVDLSVSQSQKLACRNLHPEIFVFCFILTHRFMKKAFHYSFITNFFQSIY